MLAVPASAFALTTGAASDNHTVAATTTLEAKVTPRSTHLGHPMTVSGIAPASDAGHRAILQRASDRRAKWRYVASTSITPSGRFAIRVKLRHSGFLRVIDVSTPTAATAVGSSWAASPAGTVASKPLRVSVGARFKLAHRSVDVLGGQRITVRGRLSPGRGGRAVALKGRVARGWQTLARGRTGTAGGFALRYVADSGVQRRLRVTFAGDRANARSSASAGRVTVYTQSVASWYYDAGGTACGFHAGLGVANRTLPCGTKVRIRYGGRSVTATVDDRGPFVAGREWDLNQTTAGALGFGGVGTVWVTR
jgi:hypothetical protein